VAAHRRSRRWDGEHGPRRGARAPVDHRGAVCLPGGARDRVEEAVDGRIDYGRRRRAAARGEQDSGEGMVGVGLARAEEQEERVGSLLVQGIRVGWHGEGESRRGAAAVVRCCVGEEHRADQSGKRGCVVRLVAMLAHRREGDTGRKRGSRPGSGLRRRGGGRHAPEGTVAPAQEDTGAGATAVGKG
jgi:hypothetical protein